MLSPSSFSTSHNEIDKSDNLSEIADNLLSLIECPVCFNIILPPIFQCSMGHLLCVTCRAKLMACPLCRESLSNIRNLAIEKFITTIQLPCTYKENGCKEKMTCIEKLTHDKSCRFRIYACTYTGSDCTCNWSGTRKILIYHLKAAHNQIALWQDFEVMTSVNIVESHNFVNFRTSRRCIEMDFTNSIDYFEKIFAEQNNSMGDSGISCDNVASYTLDYNDNRLCTRKREGTIFGQKYIMSKVGENSYCTIYNLELFEVNFKVKIPKLCCYLAEEIELATVNND